MNASTPAQLPLRSPKVMLIGAGMTGILHHPAKPDIKGIETFGGDMFHTAEWNHTVDLTGKRIGVIGTGSTAAQVIPEVAKAAGKLSGFQRTPQSHQTVIL